MVSEKFKELVYELEKYMERVGVENMSGSSEERRDARNDAAVAEKNLFDAIHELEEKTMDENTKQPHPSVVSILKYFDTSHLPPHLQAVSGSVCALAHDLVGRGLEGPEFTAGLRKLLEAKDCFVRSALDK